MMEISVHQPTRWPNLYRLRTFQGPHTLEWFLVRKGTNSRFLHSAVQFLRFDFSRFWGCGRKEESPDEALRLMLKGVPDRLRSQVNVEAGEDWKTASRLTRKMVDCWGCVIDTISLGWANRNSESRNFILEVVLRSWLVTAGGVEQLADIRRCSRTLRMCQTSWPKILVCLPSSMLVLSNFINIPWTGQKSHSLVSTRGPPQRRFYSGVTGCSCFAANQCGPAQDTEL